MKNLRTGRTRCLLVRPEFLDKTFYNLNDVYALLGAKSAAPPLGLLIIAAMLPKHWSLRFIDGGITPLTQQDLQWADIVFVSGIGPQEEPMLKVVRDAQALGKPVVVGGSGPSLQAAIYAEADFIICGEGEDVVEQLLDDLERGATKGSYHPTKAVDITKSPVPRYDLAPLDDYMFVGVQFTRGCPFTCEFCAQIEIFGREPRTKTPDQIIAELQELYDLGYRGMIDFGYDNLIGDPSATAEVLREMRDWALRHDHPFCYSTEATINLARHPELLELMRDNDFRYLFVGIESGDDAVLEKTKKAQNNIIDPVEAVKIFNAHSMIVNTGLILGFDGESENSAANMLRMVQQTGAFPTLVLPLHALPDTQLSRRLQKEGRLFAGGAVVMNTEERTDTATTGLNFVTSRPRVDILRDLAHVLEELYKPENHYARVALTAANLKPAYKQRPSFGQVLTLAKGFIKIATSLGLERETAPYFWRAFFNVVRSNFGAIEMVVGGAVMNANYARQSKSYIRALREQIAQVEEIGEERYNAQRIGEKAPVAPVVQARA